MYEDKTELYNKKHALLENGKRSKAEKIMADMASKKLTIFMQSIDFDKLVKLSRSILKQASILKQMTEQMQEDSSDHHRKNLKKTKVYISDVVSSISDDMTEYISEFYKEGRDG